MEGGGGREYFSATSNVPFRTEEELHEHYRSAFHRYNLKRRVAGLGPVTKEWFDTHRDKLVLGRSQQKEEEDAKQVVYFDPLSRKHFNTEAKYQEFINSNKYKKLVKANGGVRPEAVLKTKQRNPAPADEAGRQADGESTDGAESSAMRVEAQERGEEEEHSDSWETASEDEEDFEPWDPCVSLFDNHKSKNVEDNIEYMWKNFGFSIPDVEYLADPEGLIVYLGAKVGQGFIPLYSSGLDPEAKTFGSVHAVQRHMVDTGKTRMLYEDNEEEYEDFYDYSAMEAALEERMGSLQLAESSSVGQVAVSNGYELFLPKKGKTSKVLGSRSLSKYYKQSHRPLDQRQSVLANKIVARYRMLGLLKHEDAIKNLAVMNDSENKRRDHQMELKLHSGIQNAVINKLPRNVPY